MPVAIGAHASNLPSYQFQFESHPIRVLVRDGEPWFVAVDLCAVLGVKWKGSGSTGTLAALDADEQNTHSMRTPGGLQNLAIVSESGMYTLVFRCRDAVKPGTVPYRFRRWVTREVLPSIRKTGRYESAAQPSDPDRIDPRTLLLSEQSNLKTELPPKVADAVDRRAWELAREAYELTREHLRRRIAFRAAGGNPMVVNEQKALQVIMEGDLGDALAHGYHFKINCIERFVATSLQTMNELAADI
uniref:BRO-N domain-containing protein n=2 Tax=Burkholderia ambifaria TaxID=152480 RepID=UPI00158E0A13